MPRLHQAADDKCPGGRATPPKTKGQTVDMSQELVRDLIERVRLLEYVVGQLRSENRELREALRAATKEVV
jgi:hypothetical protein